MPVVNRYAGACAVCAARVPARAGWLTKRGGAFAPVHLACATNGTPEVISIVIGGAEFTRNARGRCEDAPCCGCCSI